LISLENFAGEIENLKLNEFISFEPETTLKNRREAREFLYYGNSTSNSNDN
jgi:hypothetical protein